MKKDRATLHPPFSTGTDQEHMKKRDEYALLTLSVNQHQKNCLKLDCESGNASLPWDASDICIILVCPVL